MLPYILASTILVNSFDVIISFQQCLGSRSLRIGSEDCIIHYSKILLESSRSGAAENFESGNGYFSSPFERNIIWMSYFSDDFSDGSEKVEGDLAYLPLNVLEIPAGTESILLQATDSYIRSELDDEIQDEMKIDNVLQTIDAEFKYTPHSVILGKEPLTIDRRTKLLDAKSEASQIVSKILSFAALHRLPVEIATRLFSDLLEPNFQQSLTFPDTSKEILSLLQTFEKGGWKIVEFPQGLTLRIKRDYIASRRSQFRPWPRKSLLTRSRDINEAREALREAKKVTPPPKLRPKKISMKEMDEFINQFNVKSELSLRQNSVKDLLTFFPSRERLWSSVGNGKVQQIMRVITRHKSQLLSAGRAGFVAYAMIAFSMYTISMILKWRLTAGIETHNLVQGNIIQTSIHKFVRLFASTYFSTPKLSKFHRFVISCLLAPVGNKSLLMIQRKLKITANQAVGLISSILIGMSMGLWCSIFFSFMVSLGAS